MAVNKVIFGGETVIDLTNDTVTPETLAVGVTAHDKSGNAIVGTMQANTGEDLDAVINQQATLISQLETALENAASGGGGGSVETCTVTFNDPGLVGRVIYESYENGSVVSKQISVLDCPGNFINVTLSNVVKGSCLIADASDTENYSVTGNAVLESFVENEAFFLYCYTFRINGNADIFA